MRGRSKGVNAWSKLTTTLPLRQYSAEGCAEIKMWPVKLRVLFSCAHIAFRLYSQVCFEVEALI